MNINKRMGFKPNTIKNHFVRTHETFDPNFQFRIFKLYMITTQDDKYAISGESGSNAVFLTKPDKNNKHQWVLIDGDTGTICFFYDLNAYMSIDLIDGVTTVKRSDVLLEGSFTFKTDGTIVMKNKPKYCLAFRNIKPAAAENKATYIPTAVNGLPVNEGFFSSTWRAFKEGFNAATEPVLEAVALDTISKTPADFTNTFKFVELMDLRKLTDNADTITELEKIGNTNDKRITALQKMIETNKEISDIEIQYRDSKISGYEDHWFISTFLK